MREIACPKCKYGVTQIVLTQVHHLFYGNTGALMRTNIERRCTSCGASLQTYKIDEGQQEIGNMCPQPMPPVMPDIVGPMRDDRGVLLFDPNVNEGV